VVHKIPHVDERIIISAINRGVPVIGADRDQSKPPIRQLLDLSDFIYKELMVEDEDAEMDDEDQGEKKRGISLLRRGR